MNNRYLVMTRLRNTSLTIVYHIKKKPKYRIVFEFLNLMTLGIYPSQSFI